MDFKVGAAGFEPATLWSQTRCSTGLSHAPSCSKYSQRSLSARGLSKIFRVYSALRSKKIQPGSLTRAIASMAIYFSLILMLKGPGLPTQ